MADQRPRSRVDGQHNRSRRPRPWPFASGDPGAAFFAFIERLAAEAGPKRDLFDALASAGVEAVPAVMAAVDDLRAQISCLLARAQRAGVVRADIGSAELTALLSGILFAMRPRPGTDQSLVLSVFRDGLRLKHYRSGPKTCMRTTGPIISGGLNPGQPATESGRCSDIPFSAHVMLKYDPRTPGLTTLTGEVCDVAAGTEAHGAFEVAGEVCLIPEAGLAAAWAIGHPASSRALACRTRICI